VQHLADGHGPHGRPERRERLGQLADAFLVRPAAESGVHGRTDLENVAAVQSAGVGDVRDAVALPGHGLLGRCGFRPALIRTCAGDHGQVAVHDHRVLDEHAVGALVDRGYIDRGPASALECADVVEPLAESEVRVDRRAFDVRDETVGEVRARTSYQGCRHACRVTA
jgi:hypothetical protein